MSAMDQKHSSFIKFAKQTPFLSIPALSLGVALFMFAPLSIPVMIIAITSLWMGFCAISLQLIGVLAEKYYVEKAARPTKDSNAENIVVEDLSPISRVSSTASMNSILHSVSSVVAIVNDAEQLEETIPSEDAVNSAHDNQVDENQTDEHDSIRIMTAL